MITLGYDVGCRYVKAAVIADRRMVGYGIAPIEGNMKAAAKEAERLASKAAGVSWLRLRRTLATGYGADLLVRKAHIRRISDCLAMAVTLDNPAVRTIIDVGSLFISVTSITDKGRVKQTLENEKCASGGGKFIETFASVFGVTFEQVSQYVLEANHPYKLTSSCAVFAESEVITAMNAGVPSAEIMAGIIHALAQKIASMCDRLSCKQEIAVVGGVSKIAGFRTVLAHALARPICTLSLDPQLVAACGAGLHGFVDKG